MPEQPEDRLCRPILSIVSINLNNATGLARTLTSLFGPHTSDQVEVIVVDGGSWDDTAEVLHRFANPRLRVVSEPDRGVYDAMNKGTSLSTGDYIMWLNAGDTLVSNRSLTRLEEILDSAPTWAIVGARHMRGGAGRPFQIPNLPHVWWRHALGRQPHCHQACIFSRTLVDVLGGYSEAYGLFGDFDFIMRAGMVHPPLEVPEVLVEYEGGGISNNESESIPMTLHRSRTDRLGLTGAVRKLDAIYSWVMMVRYRVHKLRIRHHH